MKIDGVNDSSAIPRDIVFRQTTFGPITVAEGQGGRISRLILRKNDPTVAVRANAS